MGKFGKLKTLWFSLIHWAWSDFLGLFYLVKSYLTFSNTNLRACRNIGPKASHIMFYFSVSSYFFRTLLGPCLQQYWLGETDLTAYLFWLLSSLFFLLEDSIVYFCITLLAPLQLLLRLFLISDCFILLLLCLCCDVLLKSSLKFVLQGFYLIKKGWLVAWKD